MSTATCLHYWVERGKPHVRMKINSEIARLNAVCVRCAMRRELSANEMRARRQAVEKMAELRRARTHCKRGHEFTPKNTYTYKNHRQCLVCKRDREFYWRHGIPIECVMS